MHTLAFIAAVLIVGLIGAVIGEAIEKLIGPPGDDDNDHWNSRMA